MCFASSDEFRNASHYDFINNTWTCSLVIMHVIKISSMIRHACGFIMA